MTRRNRAVVILVSFGFLAAILTLKAGMYRAQALLFMRAGADGILTYFAIQAAEWLQN